MKRKIILLLILLISISACGTAKVTKDKFNEGYGYISNVKIEVYGNKVNNEYEVKQFVKNATSIRIECLSPDYIKGSIIVFNNYKWKVSHSEIKLKYDFDKLLEADNYIVLGIVDTNYINNRNIKRSYKNIDNRTYEILSYDLNLNSYREKVNLYINKDSGKPMKMEMIDENGAIRIEYIYNNFEFTKSFDKNTFVLE